jgi:hypothetical protein
MLYFLLTVQYSCFVGIGLIWPGIYYLVYKRALAFSCWSQGWVVFLFNFISGSEDICLGKDGMGWDGWIMAHGLQF